MRIKQQLRKLLGIYTPYKADLSHWDFELTDMWDIIGVRNKRATQLINEIEKILQVHKQMQFKELIKEALETLPKNHTEYIWLVFYLGERFQQALILDQVQEHNAKYHQGQQIPNLELKKFKRAD